MRLLLRRIVVGLAEMMRVSRQNWGLGLVMLLVGFSLIFGCEAQGQFHGIVLLSNTHGPTGRSAVHVGDEVTDEVRIINLDDFGDHLLITNVWLELNLGQGKVTTTNLLVSPVTIAQYEQLVLTYRFTVSPEDPEWIESTAFCEGYDLRDKAGGVADEFLLRIPARAKVLRPCFQLSNHCESVGDRILVTTSITNCGNSSFPYLVASNVTDVSATKAFRGSTTTNASFTFGVSATNARPSTLTVYATDEAGLTISNSVFLDVPPMSRSVMAACESGRVPVHLVSRVLLTNLTMRLTVEPGRLENFSLEAIVPEVCSSVITPINNREYELTFSACSGQFLTGTQQVAWLNFTAISNQTTAIVRLVFDEIGGSLANGSSIKNCSPQNSRVVVVSEKPMLEIIDGENFPLALYAPLGSTNRVETTTGFGPEPTWSFLERTVMTNLMHNLVIQPTNAALYLRAVRE